VKAVFGKSGLRRFTLIELLVVVAVISVLMALLLPALGSAKRKGQSIACVGNMRQSYLALSQYSGDYGGAVLWYVEYNASTARSWGGLLTSLGYASGKSSYLLCPCYPPSSFSSDWNSYAGMPYGPSGYTFRYLTASTEQHGALPGKAMNPSKIVFLADSSGIRSSTTATYQKQVFLAFPNSASPEGTIHFRHQRRCNAIWVDGHSLPLSTATTRDYFSGELGILSSLIGVVESTVVNF